MKHSVLKEANKFIKAHRRKKHWYQIVTGMACVVVFCTVYALILPAITMENYQCGMEEHTHTEECYNADGSLVCELEEHVHTEACTQEAQADTSDATETQDEWEATVANVELTGNYADDLLAVAQTQLGYTESTENFILAEDGTTHKGYTRYGAWYEDPYGDWDAMFTSFCLHYADVEDMPLSDNCGEWVQELSNEEYALYHEAADYSPAVGDLAFFDLDGDNAADHVGIISSITETEINTIEGDWEDSVQVVTRAADDEMILGYAELPEKTDSTENVENTENTDTAAADETADGETAKEFELTAETESGITVKVSGTEDALPCPASEIRLEVKEVENQESYEIQDQALEADGLEARESIIFDISLWRNDEEIEPTGSVVVEFTGLQTAGSDAKVYHIDADNETADDMEAFIDEDGNVIMNTTHFSEYGISLTALEGSEYLPQNITKNGSYWSGTHIYALDDPGSWSDNTITVAGDITLDLNGCGLYYSGNSNLFNVVSGGKLTIVDSAYQSSDLTENSSTANSSGEAKLAEIKWDSVNTDKPYNVKYYVTESTVNSDGISTTESVKEYVFTVRGFINANAQGGAASVINVQSGGELNLQGGFLTMKNSSRFTTGDAHIISNSGTMNLSGGYICGGYDTAYGGGVYSNGTVNMTGGVIAANAGNSGGGVYVDGNKTSSVFNISGGYITGNCIHKDVFGFGGGIYAQGSDATINLSGGYITNNSMLAFNEEKDSSGNYIHKGNGCHGGGGIAVQSLGTLNMTGGYVTGNYSKEAAGGIYLGEWSDSAKTAYFTMEGGTVASNVAANSEAGGIRIAAGVDGVIRASESSPVYITNNKTYTDYDWGGGGIFVQVNGTLNIWNSLITNNRASGFGAGVGACPTGETIITHTEGTAIYGNTDTVTENGDSLSNPVVSGGGHNKGADEDVALKDPVFMDNGHKDYFCVRYPKEATSDISLVTGMMLGGGAANWSGSCDGSAITISQTGNATAKYLFGLASDPSASAVDSAKSAASVYISGNFSGVHGGGIMTNGGLILGEQKDITFYPALDITGTKSLIVDGESASSGLDYQFVLRDQPNGKGNVVGSATADAVTGKFTINPNEEYTKEGTYTYYLSEVKDSDSDVNSITQYDESEYEIQVTIEKTQTTLLGVTFTNYRVSNVVVNNLNSGSGDTDNTFKIHFLKPNNYSDVYLYVWNSTIGRFNSTGFPGTKLSEDSTHNGWYTAEFDVSQAGSMSFKFSQGNSGAQTGDKYYAYKPGDEIWLIGDGVVLTSQPYEWNGNTFTIHYQNSNNWSEVYLHTFGDATGQITNTTWPGTQLSEDSLNSGWYTATYSVSQSGQVSANFTAGKDGPQTEKLTYNYSPGTEIWVDSSSNQIDKPGSWNSGTNVSGNVTTTIESHPDGTYTLNFVGSTFVNTKTTTYSLPETGGVGTTPYTIGGLLLMLGAGTLLLYRSKRRERGGASS